MNFDELSDREQIILTEYMNLMKEIGYYHMFRFLKKGRGEGVFCIYKNDDIWESCIYERGECSGIRKYYDLYYLLLDSFETFEKSKTDYCKEVFPERVEEALKNNHKTR